MKGISPSVPCADLPTITGLELTAEGIPEAMPPGVSVHGFHRTQPAYGVALMDIIVGTPDTMRVFISNPPPAGRSACADGLDQNCHLFGGESGYIFDNEQLHRLSALRLYGFSGLNSVSPIHVDKTAVSLPCSKWPLYLLWNAPVKPMKFVRLV